MLNIYKAVEKLKAGEVIALPTETVYGLAVDAQNPEALLKLYAIKQRPQLKQVCIAIAEPEDVLHWVSEVNDTAQRLIRSFWPGPLTLILPRANQPSIGVRCSSCVIVKQIITLLGHAIYLTSANRSAEEDALTGQQVRDYFGDQVYLIEQDAAIGGVPSTIVDLSTQPYSILREGAISREQLNLP